jgi:hypothetical protein
MAHQVVNSKIGSKACFIGGGRRGDFGLRSDFFTTLSVDAPHF